MVFSVPVVACLDILYNNGGEIRVSSITKKISRHYMEESNEMND